VHNTNGNGSFNYGVHNGGHVYINSPYQLSREQNPRNPVGILNTGI